jgi:hypothetical protein
MPNEYVYTLAGYEDDYIIDITTTTTTTTCTPT